MLDPKRINVLVYSGTGTIEGSRVQTLNSLKVHLGSNYAVQPVRKFLSIRVMNN